MNLFPAARESRCETRATWGPPYCLSLYLTVVDTEPGVGLDLLGTGDLAGVDGVLDLLGGQGLGCNSTENFGSSLEFWLEIPNMKKQFKN